MESYGSQSNRACFKPVLQCFKYLGTTMLQMLIELEECAVRLIEKVKIFLEFPVSGEWRVRNFMKLEGSHLPE